MDNKEINRNIGKRMSWEEIKKTYPEMYVALEDYHSAKSDTSGILRGVAEDEETLFPLLTRYAEAGNMLWCFYTTESLEYNGLWQL